MDRTTVIWLMSIVGGCFLLYLLFARQHKWLLGLLRNALLGCAGILGLNMLLTTTGVAVGVNALTAFIVGVLGLPGFILLYAARLMI